MIDLAKLLIDLRYAFKHGPKAERRAWREAARGELLEKRLQKIRWGVSYSVFDGEELLEASLRSIRAEVDYINVVYQTISWYGKAADPGLLALLHSLRERGLIDELIEFTPDLKLKPRINERAKRNVGLKHARAHGCHYFMSMDCDEFYLAEELAASKRKILEHNFSHCYCIWVPYGASPLLRPRDWPGGIGFVPFFARLTPWSKLKLSRGNICPVDSTRAMALWPLASQQFMSTVTMHHFSLVRKDVRKKFENSSDWRTRARLHQLLHQPSPAETEYFTVPNQFNIDLWEAQISKAERSETEPGTTGE